MEFHIRGRFLSRYNSVTARNALFGVHRNVPGIFIGTKI